MFATDRRTASTANILHQATIRGRRPQVLLPNAQTSSPLTWWRTREPWSFIDRRAGSSQLLTQVRTLPICDPDWRTAAHGDASAAIAVAIRQMQKHVISAPEIDFALAAVLACALVGDVTCPVVISSALRRRSKIDPICGRLIEPWLRAKFSVPSSV